MRKIKRRRRRRDKEGGEEEKEKKGREKCEGGGMVEREWKENGKR